MKNKVIFGLGTGRCGTVTLANLLNNQPGINARHESLFGLASWRFNEHYLKLLIDQVESGVNDIAFYNLPYVYNLSKYFLSAKFVCLKRSKDQTVNSYMIKTDGRNHWTSGKGEWNADGIWDKCYPTYPFDKKTSIALYWEEYYYIANRLERLMPDRFRVFDMYYVLNTESGQRTLFEFLGLDNYKIILNNRMNVNYVGSAHDFNEKKTLSI